MQKTCIVVPCYNEASRLDGNAFLHAVARGPELHILFVNDGSTDSTLHILTALAQKHPQLAVLSLERNCGKAEAVRRGVLSALAGDYCNVGYWDADLATPLDEIEPFCRLLDTSDITLVMGSRVRLLGRKIERNPLRHYLGRIFATCASLLIDIVIYDTQCGAKIFKNTPLLQAVFRAPFTVSWIFDVEMLARFAVVTGEEPAKIAANWYEYPLLQWIDVKGSKVSGKDYLRSSREFLKLLISLRTPCRRKYAAYLQSF